MRDELAALAADAVAATRKPWEFLRLRATVNGTRMDHRLVTRTVHDPAEFDALPPPLRELTVVAANHLDLTAADLTALDQLTCVELRGAHRPPAVVPGAGAARGRSRR